MENQKIIIELQHKINQQVLENLTNTKNSNDELKALLSAIVTLGIILFAKYIL